MVGESENHQSEGVQAECGTEGSLVADRVPGKGVLDCSLSCGVLEVHQGAIDHLSDNIVLHGGKTCDRAAAC
jgi:hypothetical protein